MSDFTGYNPESEDEGFLNSLASGEDVLQLVDSYREQSLDPRQLIRVESQGQMGSCAGHSLSSNLEWIYCIATQGKIVQLSRMAGYILAQEKDGITSDAGSTIGAGVKVAQEIGLPREEFWAYPRSYSRQKPANNWRDDAANHKIAKAVRITSFEQWQTWLGSGQGGIHTGISWGSSMNRAVVETFSAGGGGHSVAALCLSDRKDARGDRYSWIANSWSESFGSKGWQEWSPTAIKQMLQHRFTHFVGLSDMPNVKPREYTLETLKKDLRI
jgi:hypothetical protein